MRTMPLIDAPQLCALGSSFKPANGVCVRWCVGGMSVGGWRDQEPIGTVVGTAA